MTLGKKKKKIHTYNMWYDCVWSLKKKKIEKKREKKEKKENNLIDDYGKQQ